MIKTKHLTKLVAGISLLAMMFVSCGQKGPQGSSDPIGKNDSKSFTQPDKTDLATSDWAYITYDLSEFAGKKVTIDFSCEMKVTGSAQDNDLQWQVNTDDYPVVTHRVFKADENDWIKVEGSNASPIAVTAGKCLYLSSYQCDTANLKISLRNIKYTVSYGSDGDKPEDPPAPAKEYPTDIFTVGDADTCGLTIGGELSKFVVMDDCSNGATINADGSCTFIAKSAGGGGGAVAFYIKDDKSEINIANYESVDVELVYSPLTGSWNPEARLPQFCLRILPYDSTGIFGGYVETYFAATEEYGTLKQTVKIPENFSSDIIASSGGDYVTGVGIKFHDYQSGNTDGDLIKIQVKSIKFNKKAGAPADQPFVDDLKPEEKGTVKSVYFPTIDYTKETKPEYNKHAWVYLPAGYDAADKDTKYPVFILLHGMGQTENTWGLTDQGRGGKIKGYMDHNMKDGSSEKFILFVVSGISAEDTQGGYNFGGYNFFGSELREYVLPYLWENYNVYKDRDHTALAGLSMGGGQTFNYGIGECLDLISYFGAFSAATFVGADEYIAGVDENFDASVKINGLYMICGDADTTVYGSFTPYVEAMKKWDRVIDFKDYTFPGGTHDFPVWYYGFNEFSTLVFKSNWK